MKRYFDTILSRSTGLPVEGALVTVRLAGTSTPATLYSGNDPGSGTLDNPVATGEGGEYSFYVADGSYDLHIVDGATGWSQPDVEIYDLDELASALGLRLTAFGAVADAQMVEDGAMAVGTPALTCASGPFSPGDVGKAIVVGGAGAAGAKLKTIVADYLSATEVTLAANAGTTVVGAGVAWGTDCSAALLAGLDALDAAHGGALAIDGYFLLTEPVAKALFNTTTSTRIRIVGDATASAFIVGVDSNETALTLTSGTFELVDVAFIGVPDAVDAQRVLFVNDAGLRLDRCSFAGLLTVDQTVRATASWFDMMHCNFGGSFLLSDGIGGVSRSVVYVDDWYAFSDESSQFIDYAYWRGLLLSKSGASSTSAFIGIGTANNTISTSSARSAGIATFRDTRIDEGSSKGIWVEPASGTITALELVGTRQNVNDVEGASGLYARSVGNVLVDRCNFGLAPSDGTAFGEFIDCGRVILDSLTLLHGVNRVRATNVDALVVRDTDITHYSLTSTAFFPENSAAGAFSLIKAGAVGDSDFPVAPGPGTIAYDRTNGRLYLRSIGDWIYFGMDGGSLLGPELVTNGNFAAGTTGWAPTKSTLSVVAGKLRVTNTGTYGSAVQSFPVEIGRQYAFSREMSGPSLVRLGVGAGSGDYLGTQVSGTTNFTATHATLYITLIVDSEAMGTSADFDNISVRAT